MSLSEKYCKKWRLYVILDKKASGDRKLRNIAEAAIRGGADVLQLRYKDATSEELRKEAKEILPIAKAHNIPLIINDNAEVARDVNADGVHVGQDDMSVAEARSILGDGKIVGKSTHSLEQAINSEKEGPDYIGLGPIYQTPTKPDYGCVGLELIKEVTSKVKIPAVCIGGIDQARLSEVLEAGAQRVAVVRAVCGSKDPKEAAEELKKTFDSFVRV